MQITPITGALLTPKEINSLNYAHIDAEVFSQFALSPSGLNIPRLQAKILLNEDATFLNIMDELDWIKNNLKLDSIYELKNGGLLDVAI